MTNYIGLEESLRMTIKISDCNHCPDGEIYGGVEIINLNIFISGWCNTCGYKLMERAKTYFRDGERTTDFNVVMKRFNRRIGV